MAVPASADDGTLTFFGRGYGHGRGMGQYGAYGYAVDHGWGYGQILGHYYGNTSLASDVGNPTISVELMRMTGRDTIVTGSGLAVNGSAVGAAAVLVHKAPDGTLWTSVAPGCGGPWTSAGSGLASQLTITAADGLPVVCEASKTTTYRGAIRAVNGGGTQYTLAVTALQDYLKGVLPREMPASWGSASGGRGLEALRAQAVAARSYALAYGVRAGSGASICDSESCQVFSGAVEQLYGGAVKVLEDSRTNAAVDATVGQVIRFTSSGVIARAEFSSSTGGWTAGGTFPAVEDVGDATASNTNRTWSVTKTFASVASALGTGAIRSVNVTARNGLGADGGRVTSVDIIDTAGKRTTVSGDTVRSKLGLKSNWFTVTGISRGQAEAVVKALYQDVLGRGPDPAGLDNWAAIVQTTGNPRLVADGIVNSKERLQALVAAEYRSALHRDPEPSGLAHWVAYLERGATVSDLQIGVFASQESLQLLGGGDVGAWVAGMYAAILGRPAGGSETAQWAQVAAAHGREAAVAGIARSQESGLQRLGAYYQRYLGRGLDPSGIASWLPEMSGRGDFTVPGLIGGSQEYWNRAQQRFP